MPLLSGLLLTRVFKYYTKICRGTNVNADLFCQPGDATWWIIGKQEESGKWSLTTKGEYSAIFYYFFVND